MAASANTTKNANWLWEILKIRKVIQIPKTDGQLLEEVVKIAGAEGYEGYSNATLNGARDIQLGDMAKYLLSQETLDPIYHGLPYFGPLPYSHSPDYLSQLEWDYCDCFYHQLFTKSDLLSLTKLLIIHTAGIPAPESLTGILANYCEMDLAEICNAVFKHAKQNGLRILLICDDPRLAVNLPSHLLRQQEDAFPISFLNSFGPDLEGLDDIMECALIRICGQDENLAMQIRTVLCLDVDGKNNSSWGIRLRQLRIANLLDSTLLDDAPFLQEHFSLPVDELKADLKSIDIAEVLLALKNLGTFEVGNLSRAWGAHFANGIDIRLQGLLGPINDSDMQRVEGLSLALIALLGRKLDPDIKVAMVPGWIDDHLALEIGWDEDFAYGVIRDAADQVDPWRDRKIIAQIIADNPTAWKRVAALTIRTEQAYAEWQSVANRLNENELLENWGKSIGLNRMPSDNEAANYLFAVENCSPEEFLVEWIGSDAVSHSDIKGLQKCPRIPGTSMKGMLREFIEHLPSESNEQGQALSSRVATAIAELLGEEVESFLSHYFPEGRGPLLLRLEEWVISKRWRNEIAPALAEDVGRSNLRKYIEKVGLPLPPATISALKLVEFLLEEIGVPDYPRFRGPRGNLQDMLYRVENLVDAQIHRTPEEIQGTVIQIYQMCETACMESIIAYAESFEPYRIRILEKLGERGKFDPDKWKQVVVGLDFGFLISLLGSLMKRVRDGMPWHAHFAKNSMLVSLDKKMLNTLDELRRARPSWVHGGGRAIEIQDKEAVDTALNKIGQMFFRLCREHEFPKLIPPTVQVVGVTTDTWGNHVELIDDSQRNMRAYHVDISEDILGRRFYLIASTNPYPLQPQLIRRIPLSEFVARSK